ncbi:hypothetical protein [Corynebacterium dentalis]|uniref:hypothetical protein n=1 Tax=Corynebacterium dentalis TaxID=2014528 RepID=UPI00289809A3|nr:hypothetical protein [Corynebacterium dentalis]
MSSGFLSGRRAVPRGVSDGLLVFVVTTVIFTIAGAVWGWLYPTSQFLVTPNRGLEEVPGTADSGFRAFLIFAAVTCVLGLLTAVWAFRFLWRGIGQLIWVAACVAFGTWWFVFIGEQVLAWLAPVYDANSTHAGDIIKISHAISPWPGIMLAPAVAMMTYWIGAVTSTDADFERAR